MKPNTPESLVWIDGWALEYYKNDVKAYSFSDYWRHRILENGFSIDLDDRSLCLVMENLKVKKP